MVFVHNVAEAGLAQLLCQIKFLFSDGLFVPFGNEAVAVSVDADEQITISDFIGANQLRFIRMGTKELHRYRLELQPKQDLNHSPTMTDQIAIGRTQKYLHTLSFASLKLTFPEYWEVLAPAGSFTKCVPEAPSSSPPGPAGYGPRLYWPLILPTVSPLPWSCPLPRAECRGLWYRVTYAPSGWPPSPGPPPPPSPVGSRRCGADRGAR